MIKLTMMSLRNIVIIASLFFVCFACTTVDNNCDTATVIVKNQFPYDAEVQLGYWYTNLGPSGQVNSNSSTNLYLYEGFNDLRYDVSGNENRIHWSATFYVP